MGTAKQSQCVSRDGQAARVLPATEIVRTKMNSVVCTYTLRACVRVCGILYVYHYKQSPHFHVASRMSGTVIYSSVFVTDLQSFKSIIKGIY